MNVNISNKFKLPDVYRIINYIRGLFTLHATQCSLYFDKHRKTEIRLRNKFCFSEVHVSMNATGHLLYLHFVFTSFLFIICEILI